MTGWTITYTKGGVNKTLYGYSKASMDLELSGIGTFEIEIPNPSAQMLTDIVNNTEIKITSWQNSLYGYVKEVRYDGLNKLLKIIGIDYGVLLQNMYVHTDNVTQEDGTLSSGYSVVYTSKAFNVVAGDVLTNTGLTAGTITNYGSTSYKFQHKTILDVIKYLASYANYDWNITTGKALNMGARLGSATTVYSFNTNINCSISNISDDGQSGGIYKIKVLGSGQGTSQIYGEWTAGDYSSDPATGRNKVKVFMDNSISSNAIAAQIASNLGAMLNGTFTSAMFSSIALNANVQLGDAITLTDAVKGGQTLRVMRIHRTILGKDDIVSYEVIDNAGRLKKMNLEDFMNKNKNLTEVLGSTAQGSIKTYVIPFENKGNTTNRVIAQYVIPPDCTSTANILKATLIVERGALKYDTTTATGGESQLSSDLGHHHHISSTTSGTTVDGAGDALADHYVMQTTATTNGNWQTLDYIDNDKVSTVDYWWFNVNIYNNDTTGHSVYWRIQEDSGGRCFPGTSGFTLYANKASITTVAFAIPVSWWDESGDKNFQIKGTSGWDYSVTVNEWETLSHTHNISAQTSQTDYANVNNPTHTNPITQGINIPSESALTIKVLVNATEVYSASMNVGRISASTDITSTIVSTGLSGTIYAYPTSGNAYLKGTITITYIDTNP